MAGKDKLSEDYINEMMNMYKRNNNISVEKNVKNNEEIKPLNEEKIEAVVEETNNIAENEEEDDSPSFIAPDDLPVKPIRDKMPEVSIEPAPEEASPEESGKGYIRIETQTAGGGLPVADAFAVISRNRNSKKEIIAILTTNASGRSDTVALPAPDAKYSEQPGTIKPYSEYDIEVFAEGYFTVKNENVPVFSGVTSLLPLNLIPLPKYRNQKNVIIINDSEPANL